MKKLLFIALIIFSCKSDPASEFNSTDGVWQFNTTQVVNSGTFVMHGGKADNNAGSVIIKAKSFNIGYTDNTGGLIILLDSNSANGIALKGVVVGTGFKTMSATGYFYVENGNVSRTYIETVIISRL